MKIAKILTITAGLSACAVGILSQGVWAEDLQPPETTTGGGGVGDCAASTCETYDNGIGKITDVLFFEADNTSEFGPFEINTNDIPKQTYVIGSHEFSRNSNSETGYTGVLDTRAIMFAARSVGSYRREDQKIYYKGTDGTWYDALKNQTINLANKKFGIAYQDLDYYTKYIEPTLTLEKDLVGIINGGIVHEGENRLLSDIDSEYTFDPATICGDTDYECYSKYYAPFEKYTYTVHFPTTSKHNLHYVDVYMKSDELEDALRLDDFILGRGWTDPIEDTSLGYEISYQGSNYKLIDWNFPDYEAGETFTNSFSDSIILPANKTYHLLVVPHFVNEIQWAGSDYTIYAAPTKVTAAANVTIPQYHVIDYSMCDGGACQALAESVVKHGEKTSPDFLINSGELNLLGKTLVGFTNSEISPNLFDFANTAITKNMGLGAVYENLPSSIVVSKVSPIGAIDAKVDVTIDGEVMAFKSIKFDDSGVAETPGTTLCTSDNPYISLTEVSDGDELWVIFESGEQLLMPVTIQN